MQNIDDGALNLRNNKYVTIRVMILNNFCH